MNVSCKAARLLVLLLAVVPLSQAAATWTTIDFPGAIATSAFGINASGQIVGVYYTERYRQHAFLLNGGVFTAIDFPGSKNTFAIGINAFEQIVGYYEDQSGLSHGFALEGQTFSTIDFPGAVQTYVTAINDHGDIVGSYFSPGRANGHGFELSAGKFVTLDLPGSGAVGTGLNGINIGGDIIGSSGNVAFAYTDGRFTILSLPGSYLTTVWGLNDRRQVVGYVLISPTKAGGIAFFHRQYVPVNFPSAVSTAPLGINLNGDIVGGYVDSNKIEHGFLRTRGTD